jgi:hypothetical protein
MIFIAIIFADADRRHFAIMIACRFAAFDIFRFSLFRLITPAAGCRLMIFHITLMPFLCRH